MRKFSKSAREISASTNLSALEVLKCFDAIPLIRYECIAAAKELNNQAAECSSSQQDESIIKYIGGYIVKKLLQERGFGPGEKHFLNKCVVNMDSLCTISEYFFTNINASRRDVQAKQSSKAQRYLQRRWMWVIVYYSRSNEIDSWEEYNDHACTSCILRVAMLYYKIEATDLPQRLSTIKQQKNAAKASENNIASNLG